MKSYCAEVLWDSNLTWYTELPDFTLCFQKSVLVFIPCFYLWISTPFEIYFILKSKEKPNPWFWKNSLKIIITMLLILIYFSDILFLLFFRKVASDLYYVDYFEPFCLISTFILNLILIIYNNRKGIQTSGNLFIYWLLMSCCGAVTFRSFFMHSEPFDERMNYFFISSTLKFPLIIGMLFINCFAETPFIGDRYSLVQKTSPEKSASFLSKLCFSWYTPMILLGYKRPLEPKDIWELNHLDTSTYIVPKFNKHMNRLVKNTSPDISINYKMSRDSINFVNGASSDAKFSLVSILIRTFGPPFLCCAFIELIQTLLLYLQPELLSLLIQFTTNKEPLWKGILLAALMFLLRSFITFLFANYIKKVVVIGLNIRTALTSLIYRKGLKLSNSARSKTTVGEIVNLMSVDVSRFYELLPFLNMFWTTPLEVVTCFLLLWPILGVSIFAAMLIIIVVLPINIYLADRIRSLQFKQMKYKDERIKLINEVLSGIKVLKLYAWEPSFEARIASIRSKEIALLRKTAFLFAFTSFLSSLTPLTMSLVSFAVYSLINENNVLDSQKAFVSLSLFNFLQEPLEFLPFLFYLMVQTKVSVERINNFMNSEEVNLQNVKENPNDKFSIVIENGTFSWNKDGAPFLKNVDMKLKKGFLIAVVGPVGAGKSSLISAFLGEMKKVYGHVFVDGSVAYVPQQAWIQNTTLKENITFGNPSKFKAYNRVIEACALKQDIAILPGGEHTEIGEKGINLSGGQKQRISLARAVYSDSDIYYLDDPLNAVDSHVGNHIFENVIGKKGLLQNKTRVMVTNAVTYLQKVDWIIVMDKGEISEAGTFQDLLEKRGAFSDFLNQHLNIVDSDTESLEGLDEINETTSKNSKSKRNSKISDSESRMARQFSNNGSLHSRISHDQYKRTNSHRSISSNEISEKSHFLMNNIIEEETTMEGKIQWSIFKKYFVSLGIASSIVILSTFLIYESFFISTNVWLSIWSDSNTTDSSDRNYYLGIYGGMIAGQALALFPANFAMELGSITASAVLHEQMLKRTLQNPSSFFDQTPLGRIINRFSKDIDVLDSYMGSECRGWISLLLKVISTIGIITGTSPFLLAVIFPLSFVYYFIQRLYMCSSRQIKRIESNTRSPIYSFFGETISGTTTIRAFSMQKRFISSIEEKVDVNQKFSYSLINANRWLAIRLELFGNILLFFTSLLAVLNTELNAGLVGLSISSAFMITRSLNWLIRISAELETNFVSVERIKEYTETPQEAPWHLKDVTLPQNWPTHGKVEFVNYSVRYRPGLDLVLKNINMMIDGGQKVGIVGRTGAGKSSLTLALLRILEPAGGDILIDDINIGKLGLHQLRSRLTIIPQDPVLFSGTLRFNLDPFETNSDNDLWYALQQSHSENFFKNTSYGLYFEISEGGQNLSVGQRQLICLARALLRKSKILILDEATAAVDLETDELVQKTIKKEFQDSTVLTIAHRINTILDYDKIIVLDQGQLIEMGSPDDLLRNKDSIFYGMAHAAGISDILNST